MEKGIKTLQSLARGRHTKDRSPTPSQFSEDYFDSSGSGYVDREAALAYGDSINKFSSSYSYSEPLLDVSHQHEVPQNQTSRSLSLATASTKTSQEDLNFRPREIQRSLATTPDEARLGITDLMGDATNDCFSPDISLNFQSTTTNLDMSSLGLDADWDLLQPSQWIAEHQKIQLYILERSFLWFESGDRQRFVFNKQYIMRPGADVTETYYVKTKLPTKCPVTQLKSIWQEFVDTDSLFSHNPSDSISLGNRSHDSEGSIRNCIDSFQRWRSRRGLVIGEAITAVKSTSVIDSDFSIYMTSLIQSRNVLVSVYQAVEYLQRKGSCIEEVSLFVKDRPKVIRLVSVPIKRLEALTVRLNLIVGSLSWAMQRGFVIPMSVDPGSSGASPSHSLLISILEEDRLESISDCPSLGVLAAYWRYLARVLDVALVTYCSSHLVSTPEEQSLLYQLQPQCVIEIQDSTSVFAPASLECLNEFVQGSVWTLCYKDCLVETGTTQTVHDSNTNLVTSTRLAIRSAYVSASIESLADIWGPVWRLEKTEKQMNGIEGYLYALGTGAIGELPNTTFFSPPTILPDEILCHFIPSRDQMERDLRPFHESSKSRLLIGVTQISGLVRNESCQTPQQDCLQGVDLRPHGTSSAVKYSAATTFTLGIGYSGTQIGVSKQYLRHPLVTRKQSLIQKWSMWPDRRNPYTLLPWLGIEVSLCTRNARRRRLVHILGSSTMSPFVNTIRWENLDCGKAFKQTLASEDLNAFPRLYAEQAEWRMELGRAVAYLLTALANTGIVHSGDLEVYTHTDSKDPDQILTIPSKSHTWVGLLKDTERSATFAITTSDCLSFPYSRLKCSGQRCLDQGSIKPQFTILETTIAPVSSPNAPTAAEKTSWSQGIPSGGRLPMQSSKMAMLKVIDYLPHGELLATWSASEFLKGALLGLPSRTMSARFQERADDSTYEVLTGARVYVISERGSVLKTIPQKRKNCFIEPSLPEVRSWRSFEQEPLQPPQIQSVMSLTYAYSG